MIINKKSRAARSEVERFCIKHQITPDEVRWALGVPASTVYAWIAGRRLPRDWEEKEELILRELGREF